MWFFLITVSILSLLSANILHNFTTISPENIQHKCQHFFQANSENQEVIDAIICGKNLKNDKLKSIFEKTSLIHLFVVSGSHFLILNLLLEKMQLSTFIRSILLFIFCILTGCSPPGIRGFLSTISQNYKSYWGLFIPQDIVSFFLTILILSLNPNWIFSLSFLLSCFASLGLSASFLLKKSNPVTQLFNTQILIYFFILIPLSFIQIPHPITVVFNLVFASLIGWIIFPLCILAALIPKFVIIFDLLVSFIILLITRLSDSIPVYVSNSLVPYKYLWLILFALHLAIHMVRINFLRERSQISV